jgi:Na+/H+-dicarboxylate symporter
VGLFFGELAGGLEVVGMIYVRGLQMTILPYIMFSLIVGFGSLSFERAWLLAKRAGILLLVFWAIGLTVVVLMTLTFPDRDSATFFNPSMIEPQQQVELLDMFIPSNPFEALATSAIPAVVLFSILFGLALIGVENKEGFLENLRVVAKTLQRVTGFVVKITPIGVFGLTAAAAGSLNLDDVVRLQVYFISYIGSCLFLTFVAFPLLMSVLTPFSYGEVIRVSKDALITAFTTGNLFVVLPIMIHDCQVLFKKHVPEAKESAFYIDILIPVTFNFPNMGKLTALLFVFFGAWYIGKPLPFSEYPSTVATGIPVFFGGIDLALPFMLQLKGLPPDLFSLYVVSGIINGRFATLLACMELLCFTLVAVSAILGKLKIHPVRVGINAAVLLVGVVALTLSVRTFLHQTVPSANDQAEFVRNMSVEETVPFDLYEEPPFVASEPELVAAEVTPEREKGFFSRLFGNADEKQEVSASVETRDSVSAKERQVIRVGIFPDNLPWSYTNARGELAGFDVEIAHRLATHLNCWLEFYYIEREKAAFYLDQGALDIVMSGVAVTTGDIAKYTFTDPYLSVHLGFLIPKQKEFLTTFSNHQLLEKQTDYRVGYVPPSPFLPNLRSLFPNLELVAYDSSADFFEVAEGKPEALWTSAEEGSALSLLHPQYTVMLPENVYVYQLAYPVNPEDRDFLWFLNQWLSVETQSYEFEQAYGFWILGKPREDLKPRWSIVRNVLGWVE